jgi:membrane protein YdbS with pleckstrin-like domain
MLFTYCLVGVFWLSSDKQVAHSDIVWQGKPWIVPSAIIRMITIIVFALLFSLLEYYSGGAFLNLFGLAIVVWTILFFVVIWLFSILELLIFRLSHSYTLRQDGLEIRNGLLRLHSFVVTPAGFGDLLVYQSIGGRIFGYGNITVNSQGERQTKLQLVHRPFEVADTMRDIMGKPIVRVESHV